MYDFYYVWHQFLTHTELHYVIFVTRMKIWVQNFTPKTRKSRLFVFTTKHVNPLLFGLTAEVSGVKLSQLNGFFKYRFTQRQKCVRFTQEVYPRPPNILHLPRIWVKCTCVGGKSTPKCNEKDNFHKALPNVKKAYVTLRKFTPDLKIFYTDISAISVTLCNSAPPQWTKKGLLGKVQDFIYSKLWVP